MRWGRVALALTAAVVMAGAGREVDEPQAVASLDGNAATLRNGCHHLYPRRRMYEYARTRYERRSKPLTRRQTRYVHTIIRCQRTDRAQRWAHERKEAWRAKFRWRLRVLRVTPFYCNWSQASGRSAIPCYIVECESHGAWWADNPDSDARGLYQLLGHGEPWPVLVPGRPVITRRRMLAHHRIAHALYVGSGSGPWAACA